MKPGWPIVFAIIGVGFAGALVGEETSRHSLEQRYQQALESQRQLQQRYGQVMATHEEVKSELERERQRSRELADTLQATRGQLEETSSRLTQESRSAQDLKERMANLQQQLDQLQEEFAMTLQERQKAVAAEAPRPVQLERIVVSSASAPGLQGRVLSIHQDWNFVIIDLGWSAVKIGDTISIVRNDQVVAKARVERVQEGACAATILPDWKTAEIRVNDLVTIL